METVNKLSGMAGVVGLVASVGEVIYFNEQLNQLKKSIELIKQEFSNNLSKQHISTRDTEIRQQKEIESLKREIKRLKQPEEDKKAKAKKINKDKHHFRRQYSETESESEESEVEEDKNEKEEVNSAARYLLGM